MRKIFMTAMLGAGLLAAPALAEGESFPPVTHEATNKECSACHMVYQPQMLPARSWEALMNGLSDHFGESAALDPAVADDIKAYLMANAADAKSMKSRWLGGLKATDTPLRISDTPRFVRSHGEVSAAAFKAKAVGSKANCIACHQGADKGFYAEPGD